MKTTYLKLLVSGMLLLLAANNIHANKQDSVKLFAYSRDDGRSGLLLAWSLEGNDWYGIGPHHRFLFSDFGTWGAQKRMFSPFLFEDEQGTWHCYWTLNKDVTQFAHAETKDFINWEPQSYPIVMPEGNILDLEVSKREGDYMISWLGEKNGTTKVYRNLTKDFKHYSDTEEVPEDIRLDQRVEVNINGDSYRGMVVEVPWKIVEALIKHEEWTRFHNAEREEIMADDPVRFARLKEDLMAEIIPQPEKSKEISDMLIGIFFEDISYAADGGLYAELVQNRDFEYTIADRDFRDPNWNAKKSWSVNGNTSFEIDSTAPIHINNKHYASLDIKGKGASLINEGWDGIPLEENKKYDFSMFARLPEGGKSKINIELVNNDNEVVASSSIKLAGCNWTKYSKVIKAKNTDAATKLRLSVESTGKIHMDMISLFPQHTFMNRKNGLRSDLAQAIADLNPRFVRFPGGCVAHGDGLDNLYRWENTIGPLEARVPQKNIWNYHQSAGLGYYEYFLFCEDLGAEAIPVVPAGVPCQNSHTGGHGQQCGIPLGEMDEYVQSVLDLIEWANGDPSTEWGKKRAEAGHPEPFNLKYLGVGNEDLITDIFEERFKMIYDAVREKYPEIVVIGTVGPFYTGSDYDAGWDLARELDIPMVDEHYYQPPGWFINNQDFYDKYDRNGTKVYLGEYASHVRGRRTNMETSLSEALYLTSIERNADVVTMTSYAPLLAKEGHTNWNPDLIYFNNTEVKPTVDYYVQQLYGNNSGDFYIPSQVKLHSRDQKVQRRFGVSIVKDEESGDLIIKLANLLPVAINTSINLEDFDLEETGKLYILQGEPTDEKVRPVEKSIRISKKMEYKVPKYSFTVIRVNSSL